jgi:hypothetical protein
MSFAGSTYPYVLAHRSELEDNWRRARAGTSLVKIPGLDDD